MSRAERRVHLAGVLSDGYEDQGEMTAGEKDTKKRRSSAEKSADRNSRRGRKPAPEAERKDRVIQTRVPRDLESTLKEAAERERVSVSHLIRNVLEDTFHLVDNIVAESANLADTVRRDALRLAASAKGKGASASAGSEIVPAAEGGETARALLERVDAWQDVVLNRPVTCIECGGELTRGQKAYRGLTSDAEVPTIWLCPACLEDL